MTPRVPSFARPPVRLRDLVRRPEPVELPTGRLAAVAPFSFRMHALHEQLRTLPAGPAQDAAFVELVRLCIPDLTDAEFDAITPEEGWALIAHASGQLELLFGALATPAAAPGGSGGEGNAPAPATEAPTGAGRRRRSPRPTRSST